ncbi:MAG: molybdopterin-dependent oxidoreductase, partial [Actinobacteria bacterium]|nr:molybdopterin-dependent oxidoreductase [Actinomycetota bacterium]
DYYVAQKFARVALRTNTIDHRTEAGAHADALITPGVTYDDVLGSDLVVVVDTDLREELPILFLRMRIAVTKRGLRIAEIGPRKTALTRYASVAEDDLDQALADASNAVILLGPRMCGPDGVHAWSARAEQAGARIAWLPRRANVVGALAAGAHPDLLPGWRRLDDDAETAQIAAEWHVPVPADDGLDVPGVVDKAKDLGVLWIVGADLLDVPGGERALEDAPFVVVQDVQMTRQLDHADLVLPAAAFVERDGTLTNWEGRRQAVFGAVDPPGSARADYAILAESARRLGRPIGCRTQASAKLELDSLLEGRKPHALSNGAASSASPIGGLRLLTYRLLYDDGLRIRDTNGIRELTPGSFAEINPDDAQGITDGASVRVSTAHGSITVRARITDAVSQGTVFIPWSQWGVTARDLVTLDDPTPAVTIEATTPERSGGANG